MLIETLIFFIVRLCIQQPIILPAQERDGRRQRIRFQPGTKAPNAVIEKTWECRAPFVAATLILDYEAVNCRELPYALRYRFVTDRA